MPKKLTFSWKSCSTVLQSPHLLCVYFGVLVLHASLTALFLKIPGLLVDLGMGYQQASGLYAKVFLLALLATIPAILLIERRVFLKVSLSMAILSLGISALGILYGRHSVVGLIAGLWLFFTAFNVLEASLPSLVAKYAVMEYKGMALGIYSAAQFLGLFLGGSIGGYLDEHYGMLAVFMFCVILALVWLIGFFSFFKTSEVENGTRLK